MRTTIITLSFLFSAAALFVTTLTFTMSIRDEGVPPYVATRPSLPPPEYRTIPQPPSPSPPRPDETHSGARLLPETPGAGTPEPQESATPGEPAPATRSLPKPALFPVESGKGERGRIIALLGGGIFPSGAEGLPEELLAAVQQALPEIVLNPGARIVVEGHTDSTPVRFGPDGKITDNRALSLQRAEAVARLLEGEGVDARRISIVGYGDTRPLAPNFLEGGRDENRRVEIRLIPGRGGERDAGGGGE